MRPRRPYVRIERRPIRKGPRNTQEIVHVVGHDAGGRPPVPRRRLAGEPHEVSDEGGLVNRATGEPREARCGLNDAPRQARRIAHCRAGAPPPRLALGDRERQPWGGRRSRVAPRAATLARCRRRLALSQRRRKLRTTR
eukprot:9319676-Alexandrium_andersonii.AAC.1